MTTTLCRDRSGVASPFRRRGENNEDKEVVQVSGMFAHAAVARGRADGVRRGDAGAPPGMNASSRLRRTSVALLLMAVLLVVPIMHCTVDRVDEHAHAHSSDTVAALSVGSAQAEHLQTMSGPVGHDGDQHMIFCVEKALMPSGGATVAPLLWMVLIGVVAAATVTVMFAGGAQGIRGPPGTGVPALTGQAILTNFCISRR
ncbi:hypothetical protein [Nocardia sienata]|uniref:hypothetical protein n=1 Tax=Nocardia sienata TaxID=248552 RepID=UPI000A7084F4|nr:hypothetical protein [Nocardia sienata]